jgi:hypothetical protein
MLVFITIVILLIFLALFLKLPDYRREMFWAGGLSIPLVLIWSVANFDETVSISSTLITVGLRLILVFLFAGVTALLYEILFLRHFKIVPHPHRAKLGQLLLGPLVFLIMVLLLHVSGLISLLVGFLAEALVLIYHRKELLWEAIVSGLFMAVVYLLVFVMISRITPSMEFSLLSSGYSGIDVFGLPIEVILFVFGYGMLWGPLYEGVKKDKV